MKTWMAELVVVWLVLAGVVLYTHGGWLETVGALAVLAAFAHGQVAERMREKEALKSKPDVRCFRWSTRYFFAKELLWLAYFVAHRSWSALVGVGVFLAYPLWRKWWRKRHPLFNELKLRHVRSLLFLNGRELTVLPGASFTVGFRWTAVLTLEVSAEDCVFIADISRRQESFAFTFRQLDQYWHGQAVRKQLRFFDSPNEPGKRFAHFTVLGIGELRHV